jgi:hypothetical protein
MGVYDYEDDENFEDGFYEDWDGPISLEIGDRVTSRSPLSWNVNGLQGTVVAFRPGDTVLIKWDDGESSTELPETLDIVIEDPEVDVEDEAVFDRGDRVYVPRFPETVGIVQDVRRSAMGFDVEYEVLWPNGKTSIEYDYTIHLDEIEDGMPSESFFPDTLPWGEDEQNYYRTS